MVPDAGCWFWIQDGGVPVEVGNCTQQGRVSRAVVERFRHISQSRTDSGLGIQVENLQLF